MRALSVGRAGSYLTVGKSQGFSCDTEEIYAEITCDFLFANRFCNQNLTARPVTGALCLINEMTKFAYYVLLAAPITFILLLIFAIGLVGGAGHSSGDNSATFYSLIVFSIIYIIIITCKNQTMWCFCSTIFLCETINQIFSIW